MASTPISLSKKVLFTTNPQSGEGDISCAIKCARSLVEAGTLEASQVEIRAPDSKKWHNFLQGQFAIGPLLKPRNYFLVDSQELEEVSNLALQVIAPSTGCGDAFFHLRRKRTKTLALFEYGFIPDSIPVLNSLYSSIGLGLGEDKAGIFIEHDWEMQHALTTRAQRMERFREISAEMQTRILGDLSLDVFTKSCGLYVGYSTDDMLRLGFVDAILKTNQNDEILVFALPRFHASKYESEMEEICRANQMKTLIISDEKGERTVSVAKEGRTVRCCVGDFNHRDFLLLWQSSEDEVLVTGDQTVSEAISANKRFCYEERDHKKAFASSLSNLFSKCSPDEGGRGILPTVKAHYWSTYASHSEIMQRIFLPVHRDHFTTFNREVCRNHNCVPYIEMVVCQMIGSEIEQKIVYLFDSDHFDPTKLEDGTVYILSLGQICAMQIRKDNGESQLSKLQGKTFQCGSLDGLQYLVQKTL